MTIDDLIRELDEAADRALPAAARRLFGPSRIPPPGPSEVEAFEAEIGTTLPDDYRQFLLRSNGGKIDWHELLTPEGEPANVVISQVGGLCEEPDLSLRAARRFYQGRELQIPRPLLWIMGDPGATRSAWG
jgi:hypothetical protein